MTKLNTFVQNTKKLIADNVFPEKFTCLFCDTEIFEGRLCKDCFKGLVFNNGVTCPKCGRKTAKGEICIECKAFMPTCKRIVSPLVFDGGSAMLVARFKSGRPYIYRFLSELMAKSISELPAVDGIVSVPMTKRSLKKRGFNQSELLAEGISALSGIPVIYGAVVKTRDTSDQKILSRAARVKNLAGCFKADRRLVKGKTLLIVDDIMTTGATLESIAGCLKKAGTCAVFAVTAASVEYLSGEKSMNHK